MDLNTIITWVLVDGGAGLAAFWLIGAIKPLEALEPEPKRYVSLALATLFALAAYGVAVAAGLKPLPGDFWAWVNAIIANVGPVLLWSQGIHGARVLSRKPANAVC